MKTEDWINVRDRLPTEEENTRDKYGERPAFLVYVGDTYCEFASYENGRWYEFAGDESEMTWQVCAWMRIIQPPAGADDWSISIAETCRKWGKR